MGEDYSKRLEKAIDNFLKSNVNEDNKYKIKDFIDHLTANDISITRQLKYFYTLKTIEQNLHQLIKKISKDLSPGLTHPIMNIGQSEILKSY